jgi:uncharacterized protein YrrD
MLKSVKQIQGFTLKSNDGEIGKVVNFLFDDQDWIVRHLVVETGNWLFQKKVLISPVAINEVLLGKREIVVSLSKSQIEASPDVDTEKPVSRIMEAQIYDHYQWPYYWGASSAWGMTTFQGVMGGPITFSQPGTSLESELQKEAAPAILEDELHLRSSREVLGYHVKGPENSYGHVSDFVLEMKNWAIRYLVVDLHRVFSRHPVLLPRECVDGIRWSDQQFCVNRSEEDLARAPKFRPKEPITRKFEERTFEYFGRSGYWESHHGVGGDWRKVG